MNQLRINPLYDLKPYINGGNLVAFNINFSGGILALIARESQTYEVLIGKGNEFKSLCLIENEKFDIHDIQTLPEEKLLLICARSNYKSNNQSEKNGRIYSFSGEFIDEILLGDGIESTQVTAKGVIWTSYFDEGVFGNYGWNDPIGSSGLISWNTKGEILYKYHPIDSLAYIHDCYSLNVTSDTTWCYYYSDFPLVKIKNNEIVDYWEIPISGSNAFSIYKNYALFNGGYDDKKTLTLFELKEKHVIKETAKFILLNEKGKSFDQARVIARNDQFYFLSNNKIYTFSIRDAFESKLCK